MNKYLVEYLGSLFFMYIILATKNALAIGAALAVAIILGGDISGGMYNPMVAVVMLVKGVLARSDFIPYILAQIAGGLTAYELFKHIKL